MREAEERNHNFVDGEHLLLALTKDQDDVSAQILWAFNVDHSTISDIVAVLRLSQVIAASAPQTRRHRRLKNWPSWHNEMRRLSDADLQRFNEDIDHLFFISNVPDSDAIQFPGGRTLGELIGQIKGEVE